MAQPIKFSAVEGGPWEPWANRRNHLSDITGIRFHAVMFDDGKVFDMSNGWREGFTYCVHCGCRNGH